ncbi:MAG: hypothetical protein ACRCTJ_03465, partial [Brevinema sp.]
NPKIPISIKDFPIETPCTIFLTNHFSQTKIFDGKITNISSSENTVNITAIQSVLDNTSYYETFQNSQLQDILNSLGNIEVIGFKKEFRQVVLSGERTKSFIRVIQNLEELLNKKIFYSIHNNKIVVREQISYINGNTHFLSAYSSFSNNSIECFPILNAEVGDTISINGKNFTISSLSTNNRQQNINVEVIS